MPIGIFDSLVSSRLGLGVATGIGRVLPPALSEATARSAAAIVMRDRDSHLVTAVRSNLWVVTGKTRSALDELCRDAIALMALSAYDTARISGDPEALRRSVTLTESTEQLLLHKNPGRPLMICLAHMSAFDLVGAALGARGVDWLILSAPDPTDQYRTQNEARRREGFDIRPISLASLRGAERLLASGGTVLTGVDRPVPESRDEFEFFGREARLPSVHTRLAARTGADAVLITIHRQGPGRYVLDAERIVPGSAQGQDDSQSPTAACTASARDVLSRVEAAIRRHPTEWAMPHPVWPEAIEELASVEQEGDS